MARKTPVTRHSRTTKFGRSIVMRHLRNIGNELYESQQLDPDNDLVKYKPNDYVVDLPVVGEVQYFCRDCIFFRSNSNACIRVKGRILAEGGCNLWIGAKAKKV